MSLNVHFRSVNHMHISTYWYINKPCLMCCFSIIFYLLAGWGEDRMAFDEVTYLLVYRLKTIDLGDVQL